MTFQTRAFGLLALLVSANLALWLVTWDCSRHYALLLSTGLLAYGFGLRHAVDADHISAIDNTTRKLMQDGKRPLGVGFFFSLGHSTVVFLLCVALAFSTVYVQQHLPQWKSIGALLGTLVSSLFLYGIGAVNLIVLLNLYRAFQRASHSRPEDPNEDPNTDQSFALGGLVGHFFRPWLRLIEHSWQMYFIGFLFGLGFDTATEIGLLTLSARSSQSGIPFGAALLLPLLFAAGMCLMDTLDGILMINAYGWAFIKPLRKLYYNMSITLLSVLVAFVVGTYELLQIVQGKFGLQGPFWTSLAKLNYDSAGFVIVGLFAAGWGISVLFCQKHRWTVAKSK